MTQQKRPDLRSSRAQSWGAGTTVSHTPLDFARDERLGSSRMIARLSGILAETSADTAVIDVGGVGYQVHASGRTLDALGPVGGEVLILTELQVREDAWTLFGFGSVQERDAFRALTSIQGVGGRLALAILSVLSPDELARAVAQEDKAMIGRANGVGPKLAARIANELKGKLGVAALGASLAPAPRAGAAADALSALANLGFKPAEASAAVNAAQDELGADAGLDALVRLALRKAAK
jgi:Holliday junction DNA helicase RuvA